LCGMIAKPETLGNVRLSGGGRCLRPLAVISAKVLWTNPA